MTIEEIKKELKNVTIGPYKFSLFICDLKESICMNCNNANNSNVFRDLGIKEKMSKEDFVSYYYNLKSGDWPEAYNDIEGYTGLYKLVKELQFRYALKEKGLKYNFDDCKKGDIFCIEFDNIPVIYFTIKDSRCFIDSAPDWVSSFIDATHITSITKLTSLKDQFEQAQLQNYVKLTLQDVEDALIKATKTACTADLYDSIMRDINPLEAISTHSEKSPEPKIRIRKNKYNFKINKNI